MADTYLSEIRLFPYNFAPRNWAMCSGQLLAIQQNAALFSLLGTTYGGNGTTNFALPDLRGRVVLGRGSLAGGSNYVEGQIGGVENVALIQSQLPAHNHFVVATSDNGDVPMPAPATGTPVAYLAKPDILDTGVTIKAYGPATNVTALANSLSPAGGSQPHSNMQPYLVLTYCICIAGIFPSRN